MNALETLLLYKDAAVIPNGAFTSAARKGARAGSRAYGRTNRIQKTPVLDYRNVGKGVAIGSIPVGLAAAAAQ